MSERTPDLAAMRRDYSTDQRVWDLIDLLERFGAALTSIRDDDWQEGDRGPRDIAADALAPQDPPACQVCGADDTPLEWVDTPHKGWLYACMSPLACADRYQSKRWEVKRRG